MASREELELILKARNEAKAAFASVDSDLKAFSTQAKKTSEEVSKLSERGARLSDSIGRTATTMARAADLFGLPVGPLRAIDDAADIAELGLKNLSKSAVGFNAASLGVVGAGLSIGAMLGGLLRQIPAVAAAADSAAASFHKWATGMDPAKLAAGPAGFDPKKIGAGHAEAQKQQIEALRAGGATLKDLQKTYKDAGGDVEKFLEKLKKEAEDHKQAAEAAKQHDEQIQALADTFSGAALEKELDEMAAAVARAGTLTEEAKRQISESVGKAMESGLVIPASLIPIQQEVISNQIDEIIQGAIARTTLKKGTAESLWKSILGGGLQGGVGETKAVQEMVDRAVEGNKAIEAGLKANTAATDEWLQRLAQVGNILGTLNGILNTIASGTKGIASDLASVGSALTDAGGAIGSGNYAAAFSAGWDLGAAIDKLFDDSEEELRKVAQQAGAALGIYVSDAIAEGIQLDMLTFGIDAASAALLSISEVAEESGTSVINLSTQIAALYAGIASGAVPAKAGIEELSELFGMVTEEVEAGSVAAMAMMGQMAAAARAIGQDVPEITAAVKAAVASSMGATGALGGIKIVSEADARAQAQIFLNVFNSTLATEGVVAAAEAIQPAIKTFQEQLSKAGISKGTADTILGPIHSAMSLLKNDLTKGGAEGAQALKTILEGQLKSGFLDTDTFGAIQQQAKTAFDQMIKGGADTKAAFQAVAPLLAQLQETARATGQALDPVTQQMIEQAKAAGVAFPVDTGTQMVDLLKELVTVMGGQLPASVQAAASSMSAIGTSTSTAAAAATSSLTEIQSVAAATSESMGQQFAAAFDVAQSGAQQFVAQLGQIAGTQIPINFKYGGFEGGFGGGMFGDGIPTFQHGGFIPEARRGRIVRVAERGTGGEHLIPGKKMDSLIAAIHALANSRSAGAALYIDGRRFADELRRVDRRRIRGFRTGS